MTQQTSSEIKNKDKKLANYTSPASLPYLAVVLPKSLTKDPLVALPVYWLKPLNLTAPSENLELSPTLINTFTEVLTESLLEDLWISSTADLSSWFKQWQQAGFKLWAEKQFLPGVTDNLAHVVEEAFALQNMPISFKVASGTIYLATASDIFIQPEYRLYHPVVERFQIHELLTPPSLNFSFPEVILNKQPAPEIVNLDISDEELLAISKTRILALSIEEMRAIKDYYANKSNQAKRSNAGLSIWPTDAELEIIAQTWSEHCKHKIFNANISMQELDGKSNTKTTAIKSLYKSYIQKPTKELQDKRKDLLSVFKDNSGIVKWNNKFGICFKVETHNSPSALEPYGGALTGILGVNRDILGTGLGAKPIFNTDVLCFAYPSKELPDRPKLLPAETLMEGVRKGIQDGGNKSGIPTVNGAIVFDNKYRAKPLVFCGTGGILPLEIAGFCAYEKHTKPGDTIVMAGGRVGKDGIHGATFSSEALHEGSPVSAVQIGDPFTQKRLLDFVLAARDKGLITGITDNGAGGLSSSVGEMATITGGASLNLDKLPTKYPGLAAWEMIVSESQERMTISTNNFSALADLAKKFSVEISNLGEFNTSGNFTITQQGKIVASLDLNFLHDGCPELNLAAEWQHNQITTTTSNKNYPTPDLKTLLPKILAHPNVCSREAVIRQYDHEVLGSSVIKPLMGKNQNANCDAAVITPILGENTGLVISNGICPQLSQFDPYLMAQCALDEAIRNALCVGCDPTTISILDNFCWPDPVISAKNPDGKKYLGMLVKSCQGLYEAALTMETPLISGKDSMKNDFDDGVIRLSIPPTLLISAIGKIHDIKTCITSQFKNAGDHIFLLSVGTLGLAGSTVSQLLSCPETLPTLDLKRAKLLYQKIHQAIVKGLINSAHDISDGGLITTICESIIGNKLGATLDLESITLAKLIDPSLSPLFTLLAEGPGHIVVTVPTQLKDVFIEHMQEQNLLHLGHVINEDRLEINFKMQENNKQFKWQLDELHNAWTTPLPFA